MAEKIDQSCLKLTTGKISNGIGPKKVFGPRKDATNVVTDVTHVPDVGDLPQQDH